MPAVMQTYMAVQQQLPADPTLESFSSANQVGIAQLAIQYCNAAVNTSSRSRATVPGSDACNASLYGPTGNNAAGVSSVTSALAARVLGSRLGHSAAQPRRVTTASSTT